MVIADGVKIGAQSGIPSSVKEKGAVIQGTPAINLMNFQKSSIVFKLLPDLRREIVELKRELEEYRKELRTNPSS